MFALRTWVRYVAALSSKASNLLHETSPMCFFKLCFGRICRSEVACPADFCHLLSHSLCGRSFGSCCRRNSACLWVYSGTNASIAGSGPMPDVRGPRCRSCQAHAGS